MKTKQGFTLIELVVACTLLMMLSTIATTTADNFMQAVKQLKNTNQVWSLKFTLAQAELNYANAIATGPNPSLAISNWNQLVQQNNLDGLIATLGPYFGPGLPPNITDLPSLLQAKGMYDPNNSANNPQIQLYTLTDTSKNPPTLGALPTVSWQGIFL
jgi:prepilin-type N-terminal cleavage/methylation domain-containing protein